MLNTTQPQPEVNPDVTLYPSYARSFRSRPYYREQLETLALLQEERRKVRRIGLQKVTLELQLEQTALESQAEVTFYYECLRLVLASMSRQQPLTQYVEFVLNQISLQIKLLRDQQDEIRQSIAAMWSGEWAREQETLPELKLELELATAEVEQLDSNLLAAVESRNALASQAEAQLGILRSEQITAVNLLFEKENVRVIAESINREGNVFLNLLRLHAESSETVDRLTQKLDEAQLKQAACSALVIGQQRRMEIVKAELQENERIALENVNVLEANIEPLTALTAEVQKRFAFAKQILDAMSAEVTTTQKLDDE